MPDRTTGENKMSKLLDLMKKLGSDAALAAEYDKDAERVMQRAGLSDEERRAMVAKDYTAIKKLTGLEDGQFADRKSVVSGKSVSVRVELGGRRIIKKKKRNKT